MITDVLTLYGAELANYPVLLYWLSTMIITLCIYFFMNIINAVFRKMGGL